MYRYKHNIDAYESWMHSSLNVILVICRTRTLRSLSSWCGKAKGENKRERERERHKIHRAAHTRNSRKCGYGRWVDKRTEREERTTLPSRSLLRSEGSDFGVIWRNRSNATAAPRKSVATRRRQRRNRAEWRRGARRARSTVPRSVLAESRSQYGRSTSAVFTSLPTYLVSVRRATTAFGTFSCVCRFSRLPFVVHAKSCVRRRGEVSRARRKGT